MIGNLTRGVSAALQMLFYVGALFWLQWQLATAAMLVVPLLLLISVNFAGYVKVVSRERRRRGAGGDEHQDGPGGLSPPQQDERLHRHEGESRPPGRDRDRRERVGGGRLARSEEREAEQYRHAEAPGACGDEGVNGADRVPRHLSASLPGVGTPLGITAPVVWSRPPG